MIVYTYVWLLLIYYVFDLCTVIFTLQHCRYDRSSDFLCSLILFSINTFLISISIKIYDYNFRQQYFVSLRYILII